MIKQNNKRTSIIMSVIALLLILSLAASFTFSWAEGGNRGTVDSGNLVINSGSSLIMRQDNLVTNEITIPVNTLEPVSSADGRNFFIPMEYNTSVDTDEMIFREGAPVDVNQKYISVDFQLQAGDTYTPVYLGAGTGIKCSEKAVLDALRMSISVNDDVNSEVNNSIVTYSDPLIFKPNQMPGIQETIYFSPITAINENGLATTTDTESFAYGDFYFKGEGNSKHIFELTPGETKNVTLTIWLEGTETLDSAKSKNFDVYIDFTTNTSDLVKYKFIDNTHGYDDCDPEYWVTNKEGTNNEYQTMMYVYDAVGQRYYAMTKTKPETYNSNGQTITGSEWEIYLPSGVSDFTFRRYSIDLDRGWNEWSPSMHNIPSTNTFVAICGVRNPSDDGNWENDVGPCGGYWQDSKKSIRIYFQLEADWDNLHAYTWNSSNNYFSLGVYPGSPMNYSHDNGENKPVYYIDIPDSDKVAGIEFNNGKDNNPDTEKYQITDKKYMFTGCTVWFKGTLDAQHGFYLYTGNLNNPLWKSVTIYSDNYNYDKHYMYIQDINVNYPKAWPGYEMHYDNVTQKLKISINADTTMYAFINNNKDGDEKQQWPINGQMGLQVEPGKSYYLTIHQEFSEYYP